MKYWPDNNDPPKEFDTYHGKIAVKYINETSTSDYVLREFEISRTGKVSEY